jgi:type II secretory ATPase GspE/PulE/Tfp pilus assembly ATPase PilB-like protein
MQTIEELIQTAAEAGASDIHLVKGRTAEIPY